MTIDYIYRILNNSSMAIPGKNKKITLVAILILIFSFTCCTFSGNPKGEACGYFYWRMEANGLAITSYSGPLVK